MLKSKKSFLILIILLIVQAIIQVIVLNQYSTNGERLNTILTEIDQIKDENTRLVQNIASSSSLLSISKKAAHLGLSTKRNLVSLTSPLPLALSERTSF